MNGTELLEPHAIETITFYQLSGDWLGIFYITAFLILIGLLGVAVKMWTIKIGEPPKNTHKTRCNRKLGR